jgi:PAS domain S-box-containing protein
LHMGAGQQDEMREYLDAIVSNSLDAICVFDQNGICEFANDAACRLVAMRKEEMIGSHFLGMAPEDLHSFYVEKWVQILGGTQGPFEGDILGRDGRRCPVVISSRRFTIAGKVKCCTVVKDITELRESRTALKLTNENLERLVTSRTRELAETVKARDAVIDALRASEEKYRELIEGCGLVAINYDMEARALYANAKCLQMLGLNREDIVGKHATEFLGLERGAVVVRHIRELAASSQPVDVEDLLETPDGPRWYLSHPSLTRDANGKPVSVTVLIEDITQKKLGELRLRESEQKYRELVENCGFMVINYSIDGHILFVNSIGARYLGRAPEEVTGKHVLDVIGPDIGGKVMERLGHVARTGQSEDAIDYVMTPDGPRWMWGHPNINCDSSGKPCSVTIFLQDITGRKLAELELQKTQEDYQKLVNYAGFIVVRCSADGVILFQNDMASQYVRYKGEQAVGRHITEVWGATAGEMFMGGIRRAIEKGKDIERELRMDTWPNGPRWLWSRYNLMRDASGSISSVVFFAHDITAQKLAHQRAMESEERYRDVVENSGIVVACFDQQGRYVLINSRGASRLMKKVEDIIGKRPTEVTSLPATELLEGSIKRVMDTGHSVENERQITLPIGLRWVHTRLDPIMDANGAVTGVILFSQDNTEQKLAETKIRESESNFRTFFESMTDMVVVCSRDGRILSTNAAMVHILGYTAEELAGMRVIDLHPEDLRHEAEDILAAMLRGEREDCPLPLARKDGQPVPVDTRIWFGKWNGEECIFGIIKNLTAEREAQLRFERLFRSNPALMAVTSMPDERFLDVNAVFMRTLGYSADEVIGRTADELGMFVQPEQRHAAAHRLATEGRIADVELQVRRKDGAIVEGLFSGEIITSQGQQYFLTVMVDITERRIAQQLARQSDERYRILLEATPLAVAWFDADARIVLANNVAAARLKKTPADLAGKRITEVHCSPAADAMEMRVQKVLAGGPPFEAEIENDIPIGRRWVRVHIDPMKDAAGSITGAVLLTDDITEQRLAGQKLRETEERYQQLMQTAGVSISCFDTDFRITLANIISAARFQKNPEEVIGKRLSDLVAPSVAAKMEDILRVAMTTNRECEQELELMLPVGRRWYWLRAVPLRDHGGRIDGVMVVSHDITEQKLVELALQESERRRRLLADTAMEGILMHEGGVLIEGNQRFFEMFGYSPEEIVGRQAIPVLIAEESRSMIYESITREDARTFRISAIRKDGTVFPAETCGRTTVFNGRLVRVVVVLDISERVKAETELTRLHERISVAERLAAIGYVGANMAHEVNTPLSVMRLTMQMLASDLAKARISRQININRATTVIREIDRTAEIIRRYREMTRPARSIESTQEDLLEVPDRVMEVLRSSAAKAKLRISVGKEVPELAAKLRSAEDAEQLFFILIENAIQAADGSKWRNLRITGRRLDGNVELRFADECCGIPPENMAKLFDPFFSTKPRDVGTGLGLCIVKRLLQECGGHIDVESRVGEGTTFTVVYPV